MPVRECTVHVFYVIFVQQIICIKYKIAIVFLIQTGSFDILEQEAQRISFPHLGRIKTLPDTCMICPGYLSRSVRAVICNNIYIYVFGRIALVSYTPYQLCDYSLLISG